MYLYSAWYRHPRSFIFAVTFILFGGWHTSVLAQDAVTLQLRWSHAFQFAGYYAAKEKGYYRDAGLDVSIQEAHAGDDPIKNVLDGKAQYGVGNSSLLVARKSGQPVVALAVIFQHSPQVLISRQQGALQGIQDLLGKRVMFQAQTDELLAYLKQEGIPLDRITRIEHSFNPQDLIDGKVDAISAYITSQPFFLDRAGFAYNTYTPRSVGIDFYGDNLFTTEHELTNHPARVKAFREASLRGWNYAMSHPEEIIDLILTKYSQQNPREFYLFEARKMIPLISADLIEIGYMNPGRWRHIADTYSDLGLLPKNYSLAGFLYNEESENDLTWLYLAGVLLFIVSSITLYIHRSKSRLAVALAASTKTQKLLQVSEEKHRLLADNATDVIWMMNLDGRFTYVSPSVKKLRGYTSVEVMQQSLAQAFTETSIPIAAKAFGESIALMLTDKSFIEYRVELEQPCKDKSTVWTDVTTSGMKNTDGEFIGILAVSRDITARKLADIRIRESEQRFRDIAEVSADWIWEIDAQGRYTYASDSIEKMLGYAPQEVLGKTPFDLMTTQEAQRVAQAFGSIFAAKQPFSDLENIVLSKSGAARITLTNGTPILDKEGNLLGYRGIDRDITERKFLEDQILQLAFYDALTHVANRRLLQDRLSQAMATSKRSGCYGALMFLDLDNFKPLNDTHGHEVGDLLLIEAANRLKNCVRETDTVARFGGDEFVVMLSELNVDRALSTAQAETIAEKILCRLSEPYRLRSRHGGPVCLTVEHHCTASIGVALFMSDEANQDEILKWADVAMYVAKEAGRNSIQFAPETPSQFRMDDQHRAASFV